MKSPGRNRGARALAALAAMMGLGLAAPVYAHPTPFSYVDIRVSTGGVDITISGHIVDVAHELSVPEPEALVSGALPDTSGLLRTLLERLRLRAGDRPAACHQIGEAVQLPATQAIRWSLECDAVVGDGIAVDGPLFPYDPEHQTFVNLYVNGALIGQSVLDRARREASFPILGKQSRLVTFGRFLVAGIEHILAGPDHLLFLAGLLLMGGTVGRLTTIVTAFTAAHSVTLALAVVGVVAPPPAVIEPLIALSIVFVGVRNLRPSGNGDWRILTAAGFGLIHGFGFAYALREMQLPRGDLGWALLSFNLGVEVGQVGVVLVVATVFGTLRRTGLVGQRRLLVAGSIIVATAGAFWFVQRVVALWIG